MTASRRGKIVAILAVDNALTSVEKETMGRDVQWIEMPQAAFDKVMGVLYEDCFYPLQDPPRTDPT